MPARPSARRSCRTSRVVPEAATTPSCPPETVRSLAVRPSAPRSTRRAVRESRTATPWSATSLPSAAIPATEAPWIVEACMVRPWVVFSITTPRRPPVIVSWSSATFVLLTWVNTPAGSSVAVRAETVTSRDWLSSRPPLPSAVVADGGDARAGLLVEADPVAAVAGRDDAGDRAVRARARHLHAVRAVVLGADSAQRRAAVAAQDEPGARGAADGDTLEAHTLRSRRAEARCRCAAATSARATRCCRCGSRRPDGPRRRPAPGCRAARCRGRSAWRRWP